MSCFCFPRPSSPVHNSNKTVFCKIWELCCWQCCSFKLLMYAIMPAAFHVRLHQLSSHLQHNSSKVTVHRLSVMPRLTWWPYWRFICLVLTHMLVVVLPAAHHAFLPQLLSHLDTSASASATLLFAVCVALLLAMLQSHILLFVNMSHAMLSGALYTRCPQLLSHLLITAAKLSCAPVFAGMETKLQF